MNLGSESSALVTRPLPGDFRRRLLAHDLLVGTFVKTPHASVVEVIGHSTLDCICLDAEHAPFDRNTLDTGVLASRAAGLPCLIRVQRQDPPDILNALDLGATGVLIPHVISGPSADAAARAARFMKGGRGYAGSTRAAGHTTRPMTEVITKLNDTVAVIAQIEDAQALDELDAIAAVDGIDALFIGRMDLTVSLGAASPLEPVVIQAVREICAAAHRHSKPVGMFTSTPAEARLWVEEGVTLFLLGSDQQWILDGARRLCEQLRAK